MTGWVLGLACALPGAAALLTVFSPWLAAAAIFPLAVLLSVVCRWQASEMLRRAENCWREKLALEEAKWREVLAQHIPVLPVLAAQLKEAAEQLEVAVERVCDSFEAIAFRAKKNVTEAAITLGDYIEDQEERESNVRVLSESACKTLRDLVEQIIQGSRVAMKTVYPLEDMEKGLSQMTSRLEEAEESRRALEGIQPLVQEVHGQIQAVNRPLKLLTSTKMGELLARRDEVEQAITYLRGENEHMRHSVLSAAKQSEQLNRDISQAVTEMQFRDIVSQRFQHGILALLEIEKNLYLRINSLHENSHRQNVSGNKQWANRLQRTYALSAERKVMAEHTGHVLRKNGRLGRNGERL